MAAVFWLFSCGKDNTPIKFQNDHLTEQLNKKRKEDKENEEKETDFKKWGRGGA